jgi:TatD DNase family protein
VILHVRRAQDQILKQLRRYRPASGIAHAFNGSEQQARQFIGLGFALGFGGAMTYTRALQIRRLAVGLPEEAIVLETDAPDIPPAWLHGERNTPIELPRIAEELAALRKTSVEEVARFTTANALRVLPRLSPS